MHVLIWPMLSTDHSVINKKKGLYITVCVICFGLFCICKKEQFPNINPQGLKAVHSDGLIRGGFLPFGI